MKNPNNEEDRSTVVVTDLMANMAMAFLLALSIGIMLAGGFALAAQSSRIEASIAALELEHQAARLRRLAAAESMIQFLEGTWQTMLVDLTEPVDALAGQSVFVADAATQGVRLNADILFGSGSSRLRSSDEAVALIDAARERLCDALDSFQSRVANDPVASRVLEDPYEYIEVVFEGHADRVIGDGMSNWELSSSRAMSLLLEFSVDERDAAAVGASPCRMVGTQRRIESQRVRVIAAGRGSMDAGGCGDEMDCPADRYALIRTVIRVDKVLQRFREVPTE